MVKAPSVRRRAVDRTLTVSHESGGNAGDESKPNPSPSQDRHQPALETATSPDYRHQLRRFSSISIVAILISAMLLVMVYRYFTLESLLSETASANYQLAEATETVLADVLTARTADRSAAIPVAVDETIHEILTETNIKRIRLLDTYRNVLFAASKSDTDPSVVTADSNTGLTNALAGHPDSRMAYRDAFNTVFGLLPAKPNDNLVTTASPLQKGHRGPVLGIVEIQADIGSMAKRNEKAQILIALTAVVIMTVLFASLAAAIKRMQRVVEVQHHALQERSDLLAALSAEMLNVQEEEKQRIARDLHERVAQTLAAIKFGIESTSVNVRRTDEQASKMLQALLDPVREAIQEVRQTATELHPASLDDLGLVPTLNWLCQRLAELRNELTIDRDFSLDESRIPKELQPILFRIAEEACRVYKSAVEVRHIALSIQADDDHIAMELRDDALPPYADDAPPHPYHRIHDRALLSGGTFSGKANSWGGLTATIIWDTKLPTARPRW